MLGSPPPPPPPPPPTLGDLPHVDFFLDKITFLNAEYFSPSDVKISKVESPETFSVLYLNTGSLRKNLEDVNFSIVFFSETWTDDNKLKNDSLIQLPGYVLHQMRKNCRGGGISIFLHKSLYYKRRQNWYKFGSSGLFYHRNLEKLFLFFHFNLNVLDFENNKKVQNFINLMFCYGMISTIKRPHTTIRIMANMATANVIINTDFKTRILKIRVSERFDIMLVFQIGKLN